MITAIVNFKLPALMLTAPSAGIDWPTATATLLNVSEPFSGRL